MTAQQATQLVTQHGAAYVGVKDNIQWWRLRDGSWLAVQMVNGQATVKHVKKCNCGS